MLIFQPESLPLLVYWEGLPHLDHLVVSCFSIEFVELLQAVAYFMVEVEYINF